MQPEVPNIVVIGSCSVDFTTYAPRLPKPGETLHGTKFTTSFGGKGANQCVAATKLGGNTYMICRLGDDHWGKLYKDHLKETGVNVDHVYTSNTTTGIAQITVADNGENQIVIVPGANGLLSVKDVETSREVIKNADILIAQSETPLETTLEAFKCNSKGIKLLNAAPALKKVVEILPYCTILCLNESEASILIDQDVNLLNVSKALETLLKYGCEVVIITLGGDGAVFTSKKDPRIIHVPCEKVKPVDTTGAGDAFVGALAKYIVSDKDLPLHQIVGAACHIASLSVTREGTQTSYPSYVEAFNKEYKYEQL